MSHYSYGVGSTGLIMASGSKFSDNDEVPIVEEEENSMELLATRQISTPNKNHIWRPSYGIIFETPVATPSTAFLDCSIRPCFARSLSAFSTLQQQRYHTHARRASLPKPLPYKSVTAPSKKMPYGGLEIEDDEVTVNRSKREGIEKMLQPGLKSVLPAESKEETKILEGSTGLQKMPSGGVINIATTSSPGALFLQPIRQPVSPPLATQTARHKVERIQKRDLPPLEVKRNLISISQDRDTASLVVKSESTHIKHSPTTIDQHTKANTTVKKAITFKQDRRHLYHGETMESAGISQDNKVAIDILRRGSFERRGVERSDEEVVRIAYGGDHYGSKGSTNSIIAADTALLNDHRIIQDKPGSACYVHHEKSAPRSESYGKVALEQSKNWRLGAPKRNGNYRKRINASKNSNQLQIPKDLVCWVCDSNEWHTTDALRNHMYGAHGLDWIRAGCDEIFATREVLAQHLATMHQGQHDCVDCAAKSTNHHIPFKHRNKFHKWPSQASFDKKTPNIMASEFNGSCKATFPDTITDVTNAEEYHSLRLKCPDCDQQFDSDTMLLEHSFEAHGWRSPDSPMLKTGINENQLQVNALNVQVSIGDHLKVEQMPSVSKPVSQLVVLGTIESGIASLESPILGNGKKVCRTLKRQEKTERKALRTVATNIMSPAEARVYSAKTSQLPDSGSPQTKETAKPVATVTHPSATSYHVTVNPKNIRKVYNRENIVRRIHLEERSTLKAIRKTYSGRESWQLHEVAVGVSDRRSVNPMKVQQLPPFVNPPCLTAVGSPPLIGSPPLFSGLRFYPSEGISAQRSFTTSATCPPVPSSDPHLFVVQGTENFAGNPSIPLQPDDNTHQSDPIANGMAVDADTTYVPRFHIPDAKLREMMLASPQTGAAYWQYTLYQGPNGEKVKVHYCQSNDASERIAKMFLHEKVLGFDIEWKPQVLATEGIKKNVSLIQLASEERIALFHIARYGKSDELEDHVAPTLKLIMESPDITKVGVSIKADCTRLRRFMAIQARGLFELSHLYKLVRFSTGNVRKINKWLVALAQQVEEHLQLPMWKGPVRSSDWSSSTQHLTFEQIQYAASDSYAGLQIYNVLEAKRRALNPVPPRPAHAELNLPIRLANGQTAATYDEDLEADNKMFADQENTQSVDVGATTRDFASIAIEDDTSRFSTPKPVKKISKFQSPEVLAAEAWVANWRSNLPPNHKLKATPANLRAYALWYDQAIGIEQAAALLRDPPLQHATVAAYVISTVNYENLPFDQARLRDVFGYLPEGARERFQRLRKACGLLSSGT